MTVEQKADAMLFNDEYAGRIVSTSWCERYRHISIDGVSYPVHRVVWKMAYDQEPIMVDHIDGDTRNNRIENLRAVSAKENAQNKALPYNHETGYYGVRETLSGRWLANIGVNGKNISLGTYDTKQEAVGARLFAEGHYGFHPNHGREIVEFTYDYKRDASSPWVIKRQKQRDTYALLPRVKRHKKWPSIGPERLNT